jgi:hypothetical protein
MGGGIDTDTRFGGTSPTLENTVVANNTPDDIAP